MAVLRDYHLNLVALFLRGHPETPIWDRVAKTPCAFVTCHTSSFGSEVTLWILVWSFITVDFHPDCKRLLPTSSCFYFSWCYCHIFPTVLDQIPDQGASTGMAFTNRRIIPVPGCTRCLEFQVWEANFCWLIRSLLLLSSHYSDWHDSYLIRHFHCLWIEQLQQKMCFNTGLGIQKKITPQPSDAFLTCRPWGLQSAPIPCLGRLGHGRCCKPWRCRLEPSWASTRKRSLETSLFLNGSFTTKEDVNFLPLLPKAGMLVWWWMPILSFMHGWTDQKMAEPTALLDSSPTLWNDTRSDSSQAMLSD